MKNEALEKEFDRIFWEYKDMVYYTALRYFKKREDAEEIVQETFLKVFLNMEKFKGASSLKTWITRIALNEIYNRYRKEKKHQWNEVLTEAIEKKDTSIENWELKDLKERFFSVLKTLPKKREKVVFFRIMENLSFKEIGEMLSISENSAKNLFAIGIKQIRKKMEAYYER